MLEHSQSWRFEFRIALKKYGLASLAFLPIAVISSVIQTYVYQHWLISLGALGVGVVIGFIIWRRVDEQSWLELEKDKPKFIPTGLHWQLRQHADQSTMPGFEELRPQPTPNLQEELYLLLYLSSDHPSSSPGSADQLLEAESGEVTASGFEYLVLRDHETRLIPKMA